MAKNKIKDNIKTLDVNEIYGVAENKRTEYSIAWYRTALDNLLTARILLMNNRLNHCVFFLQQCIECIIKGILIENKFIDNAKDFNHNPECAIELFYKQTNSISIKYCESIKEELKNIKDFESRLIKIVGITNLFTEEYNLKIKSCPSNFMVNSIALQAIGLKESSSKEDVYRYIEKVKYTNNLIYCIAILFDGVQQNTRYPIEDNGKLLPSEKYLNTISIIEGLNSIIPLFNYILNTILYG